MVSTSFSTNRGRKPIAITASTGTGVFPYRSPDGDRASPVPGHGTDRGGEKVSLSGATMADVLGARPIGGRIAENMEGVAFANTANTPNTFDLQEKTIAPAIDYMGPDGLSREQLSPGMQILQELRAKRAARPAGRKVRQYEPRTEDPLRTAGPARGRQRRLRIRQRAGRGRRRLLGTGGRVSRPWSNGRGEIRHFLQDSRGRAAARA